MSDRTQSTAARGNQVRDEIAVIRNQVLQQEEKYRGILPSSISFAEFSNTFLTAVQMNPRLLDADRQSLFLALQRAASDGLKPDGREGALVIFGDDEDDDDGNRIPSKANAKKKVVWMAMVWGLLKTVRNAAEVKNVTVECVYKGEFVRIVLGDEPKFEHERSTAPDFDDSFANIIGAYAIVVYKNGAIEREWMSRAKIDRVRATSRARKGPWGPWYDEQARKTVLRRLTKRLDRSADLRHLTRALEHDETIGKEIEGDAAVEIQGGRPDSDQIIREEFQQHRQPQEPTPIRPSAVQQTRPYTVRPATQKAKADTQPNPKNEAYGQPDPFEVMLVDENGEVIGEPFIDPVLFAKTLTEAAAALPADQAAGLIDSNLESIDLASAYPAARTLLAQLDHPRSEPEPGPVIADSWPKWRAAIQDLAPKQSKAALPAWVSAQQERILAAPASQRELAARAIRVACAEHGLVPPPWIAPPQAAKSPSEPEDTTTDADQRWVVQATRDLEAIAGIENPNVARTEFNNLVKSVAVQRKMTRLSAEKPALFAQAKAFFDATDSTIADRAPKGDGQ